MAISNSYVKLPEGKEFVWDNRVQLLQAMGYIVRYHSYYIGILLDAIIL
jgi:hypothetical protein